MKTLIVFLLGVAVGAFGMIFYEQYSAGAADRTDVTQTTRDGADRAIAKTRAVASDVSDAFSRKMKEWRLTPDDIRNEFGNSGQVVRQNAARARDKVSDVRIVAMIKAKYVLDGDLSANDVTVTSEDGKVTLTGRLASEELVGKAVAHALDTDGVHNVTSKITVGQ